MAFTVKLNGSNYVSEKTRAAFERALQDNQQVHLPPQREDHKMASPEDPAPSESNAQPEMELTRDYPRVLEILERGLAQSYEHQRQTLRVHEQYLHHQGDYAQIFSQLMQQQNALFANGNSSPERLEAALTALEQLSRSIDQFHEHQAQTLHVHNAFLSQQAAYTQAFLDLLRRQSDVLLKNNGTMSPTRSEPRPGAGPVSLEPVSSPSPPTPEPEPVSKLGPVSPPRSEPGPVSSPSPPTPDLEALTASLLDIVSEKTGYPAEMLELDMDMEADLGIDSIKRVEILSALQDKHPALPEVEAEDLAELRTLGQITAYMEASRPGPVSEPEPVSEAEPVSSPSPPTLDPEALTASLLDIVSEKTGYPAEMLELDMDMEADLGIDSIKRVEILSALQDKYPALPEVEAEDLAELRTLGQITAYMESQQGDAGKKA